MQKTKVFEQWLLDQQAMIVRYRQVEKSDVLAEYKQLKTLVESQEFQSKKNILTTTKYADTPEAKLLESYINNKPQSTWRRIVSQFLHLSGYDEE